MIHAPSQFVVPLRKPEHLMGFLVCFHGATCKAGTLLSEEVHYSG